MRSREIKGVVHFVYEGEEFAELHPDETITDDWREDQEGDWVLTDDGTVVQILRRKSMYRTDNSGLPSNVVLSIHVDNSGSKWIGTLFSDGVAKLSNNSWEIYGLSTGLYLGQVQEFCSDANDNVWFAGAFFYKYDGSQWTRFVLPSELYSEASGFSCIACDSDGSIWVGSILEGLFFEPNNSD